MFSGRALMATARSTRKISGFKEARRTTAIKTIARMTAMMATIVMGRSLMVGAQQPVQMHADVGGFSRGVGECDGAIKRLARFLIAAELHQERAPRTEKMEIA